MRTDPRPEEVRQLATVALADFGAMIECDDDVDETILVDAGRYMARCYKVDSMMAMWLVEVGLLQVYSEAGDMLATINLFEALAPQRAVA